MNRANVVISISSWSYKCYKLTKEGRNIILLKQNPSFVLTEHFSEYG